MIRPMKLLAILASTFLALYWLWGCGEDEVVKEKETTGSISVRISMPDSSSEAETLRPHKIREAPQRDIQAIQAIQAEAGNIEEIVKVVVTISGVGLTNPRVEALEVKERRAAGTIGEIPVGDKDLDIKLQNASGKVLYTAAAIAKVVAGQTVSATSKDGSPIIKAQRLNQEVKADFTVTPNSGNLKTEFEVDASSSADTHDSIDELLFHWDWEWDGTDHPHSDADYVKGKLKDKHVYTTSGKKTIRLVVKDSGGKTDTKTLEITVEENKPPTASFTISPSSAKDDRFTNFSFDASSSSDAEDSTADLEVKWNWGDGSVKDWSKEKLATHSFGTVGEKTISLEVRDTGGAIDKKVEKVTIVPDKPSNPTPSNRALNQDLSVTLRWEGTSPSAGSVVYDVYFGPIGNSPLVALNTSNLSLTRSNLQLNTQYFWRVVAKVEADLLISTSGDFWSFTTKRNTNPTASFSVTPSRGDRSTTFNVDASSSSDLEDPSSQLQVRWDWEDDGIFDTSFSTVKTASHRYTTIKQKSEQKRIKLEVRDTTGAIETTTQAVTVENRPPSRPTVLKPADKAANQLLKVNLSWTADDPDGEELTYELSLGETSVFSGPNVIKQTIRARNSFDTPTLDGSKTYFWKVIAKDEFDSVEGPVWSFTTLENRPPTVRLTSETKTILIGFKKGTIPINAEAQDQDGRIEKVIFEYSIDNIRWEDIGTDEISPYSWGWNSEKNIPRFAQTVWVRATAIDNDGAKSEDKITNSFSIDNEPPDTRHDYDNKWHITDFPIRLTADDFKGSGIKTTKYKINTGAEREVSKEGPPFIQLEGADNVVEFWSLDNAGNEETPHNSIKEIKLDKTRPNIVIREKPNLTANSVGPFRVTFTVTDKEGGSGLRPSQFDYHIGASPNVGFRNMIHGSGDIWILEIPQPSEGWSKHGGESVIYIVRAQDIAGNETTLPEQTELIEDGGAPAPISTPIFTVEGTVFKPDKTVAGGVKVTAINTVTGMNRSETSGAISGVYSIPFEDRVKNRAAAAGDTIVIFASGADGNRISDEIRRTLIEDDIRRGRITQNVEIKPTLASPLLNPQLLTAVRDPNFRSPLNIAISPDGARVFVTNSVKAGSVSVIDIAARPPRVLANIPVGALPIGLAIDPTETVVYVANSGSEAISFIDYSVNEKIFEDFPVAGGPTGIATDGISVYVSSRLEDSVSTIDIQSRRNVGRAIVGDEPIGLAITADGSLLYVANSLSNSVSAIDTATNKVSPPIPVGRRPTAIVASQHEPNIYVVNSGSGDISVIDEIDQRVKKTFPVGRNPRGIAVIRGESGDFLYVTNFEDNSLTAIEVATGRTNTIPNVGVSPAGIAATPDGKRLFIASSGDASVVVMGFPTAAANRRR